MNTDCMLTPKVRRAAQKSTEFRCASHKFLYFITYCGIIKAVICSAAEAAGTIDKTKIGGFVNMSSRRND